MKTKQLESQFDQALAEVCQTVREFPWEDPKCYAAWLAQTYYFVRHSTQLLSLKAAKYGPDQPEKHRGALTHLREESGHDVMALRDLKKLGFRLEDFPEKLEIALFYQSQFYWLDQHGPLSFTGYVLCLEEMAAREGAVVGKKVLESHGKEAASFLLLHAKADLEHTQLQRKEMEGATDAQLEAMLRNLRQSAYLYNAMLRSIMAEAKAATSSRPKLKIAA